MDRLDIERVGGFAGFGGPNLKSKGHVTGASLSDADRHAVEALFASPPSPTQTPDGFSYRLTRHASDGARTIEVAEQHVPEALRSAVRDELA